MRKSLFLVLMIALQQIWAALPASADTVDLTEPMKESLVYLEISNNQYEQYQPWKQSPISKDGGYACAVGPYEILTTAENVMNAAFLQARCYGQNEYIPVTIKVIDHEYNLSLLKLDESAMTKPLKPLKFKESFPKGRRLDTYWLSAGGHLTNARSTLDRAEMRFSDVSFVKNLFFLTSNNSRPFGDGEACCHEKDVIGIACWGSDSEAEVIPAETINRFLSQARKETYKGFGLVGFEVYNLLDPIMRRYLKMPEKMNYGVYVSTVYNLGTGSTELQPGDVILSIDGHDLNPYGRYLHPEYDRLSFENIIMQKSDGQEIPFVVWRNGQKQTIKVLSRNFQASDMLVPHYLGRRQPEYTVVSGFVFQQLTRNFLTMWGDGWAGKTPPHLFQYYGQKAFKPTDDRQSIVVLNYVLPTEGNLGYQQLSRMVVSTLNNRKIRSLKEFNEILNSNTDSAFHVIEFEMGSPKVVIPKAQLAMENMMIAQIYGIPQLSHIED